MSFNATVNLGTVGSDITGQTVSISGCTGESCGSGCSSLVTTQAVSSFPKVITGIPDNVVSLYVKVDGGSCVGVTQCITVTGGGGGATPTPTKTITPTITPTYTITPTLTPGPPSTPTPTITPNFQYWYELTRCDDPNTVCYSVPFEGGAANVGKIFWSAGGYYYTMGNYWNTNDVGNYPGTGDCGDLLDGTILNSYNCSDYVTTPPPPPPTPGISMLVHTGSTFGGTATPCAMYESDIATNSVNLYLSGHTIPANGDYAYTENTCINTFDGNGMYYAVLANSTKYAMTIGPTGYINNVLQCNGGGGATPTPTITPTLTITPPIPYYQVDILQGNPGDCSDMTSACYRFNTLGVSPDTTIYTASGTLLDGETAYATALGPIDGVFDGNMYYYTNGSSYVRITNGGTISIVGTCTDSGPCN